MTPTLSDLRRLLEGGLIRGGPAIDRPPERTVEALAAASLPRSIWRESEKNSTLIGTRRVVMGWYRTCALDLTDSGTACALLIALALFLGLDPGVGALGVMWYPSAEGWCLGFLGSDRCYKSAVFHGMIGLDRFQDWHYAPPLPMSPTPSARWPSRSRMVWP